MRYGIPNIHRISTLALIDMADKDRSEDWRQEARSEIRQRFEYVAGDCFQPPAVVQHYHDTVLPQLLRLEQEATGG